MSATSHETVLNVEHAQEAGIVLGHFQNIIADFPADQLEDTLPGFHITPGYLAYHDEVVQTSGAKKRLDASSEAVPASGPHGGRVMTHDSPAGNPRRR